MAILFGEGSLDTLSSIALDIPRPQSPLPVAAILFLCFWIARRGLLQSSLCGAADRNAVRGTGTINAASATLGIEGPTCGCFHNTPGGAARAGEGGDLYQATTHYG